MGNPIIRQLCLAVACLSGLCWGDETKLAFASAPVANPLKGLVPYAGAASGEDAFPHSMEFSYLALADLVVGERRYDWGELEALLDKIASRHHQAVLRIYVEYPDKASGVPDYLGMDGVPDYESPALRACLRDFIAAFGGRYDGDARIGFLTAGLLGKWGEWHTWPEPERWASREVQAEVLDAYEKVFKQTPVLLRYPVGEGGRDEPNVARPFGYHDDSFAWATLDTGGKDDFWFYMTALKMAGGGALDKWRRHPIGGEIRPEAWGICFDEDPGNPKVQDFAECVRETHVTWLMDSGMFGRKYSNPGRRKRAEAQVRRMGYELYVSTVSNRMVDGGIEVSVAIENRGVAPFYAGWPIEWGVLDARTGKALRSEASEGTLEGIPPGEKPARRSGRLELEGVPAGRYFLAMRVANPMPGGLPVRFANQTQDQHAAGWLSLVEIRVP